MKNTTHNGDQSVAQREVAGFVAWAQDFIGTVRDGSNKDMTDEFWDQLAALEYAIVRKPQYEAHDCVSPCEQGGARCIYPRDERKNQDRHCLNCGWVQ